MPETLWTIAWIAKKGDEEAEVIVEYVHGGEDELVVTWDVLDKNRIRADVWINTLDRAAALVATAVKEGDKEEEKRIIDKAERGGKVALHLKNLLAMAQYDEELLEWAMLIKIKGMGR